MDDQNQKAKEAIGFKKDTHEKGDIQNMASFEYSFFKFFQLKINGNNQSEIRKTVLKTWWLSIMPFIFATISILLAKSDLIEKIFLILFK